MFERTGVLQPTAVNTVLAEARALQAQGRTLVSLMRGEPDFPTPAHIVDAGVAALRDGRTAYAENRGEKRLREAVAAKLARDNRLRYDAASEILITDGATMGIYAALMAVLNAGEQILVPDPVYDAYQSAIRITGAAPQPVASTREGGRFTLHVADLEAAYTAGTRALLLNTPWNPVGTVFSEAELAAIAEFVCRRDLVLISDEIYEAITYDGKQHVSPATLSTELRERCILVNSLSKTYAMTGWRLGYCAAPSRFINAMLLILQQASRGPATFIQDAGAAALTGPQECVAEMRAEYAARREHVSKTLNGLPHVTALAPEGGFFTMLDIQATGRTSDDVRRYLLHECGVVVIHGRAYGVRGEGTLRVSFASGGDTLSRGLALLRQGLQEL